ncbi:PP2C family protein-serine/threonine phosphatase [Haloferula chungangensis]|uniref:PP2C family protein-serine/threonine phosphatase n=1 Tax=Haloferula chungangensis TaxID=1048331 RepID=A0ABW2LA24_9BACT
MESSPEVPTPKHLRWSGVTDPGRFRANNEDAFLAVTFDAREFHYLGREGEGSLESSDFVFAVSDGMGGAKAGEVASKIAVENITRLLPKSFGMAAQHLDSGFSDVLSTIFERTHRSLRDLGRHYEECSGMGATLSLCWFMPDWMAFAHVGDSRIYYLPKNGDMIQVTDDHSGVGSLFRQGKINERQARTHPRRNVLNRVLGGKTESIEAQTGRVGYESGDRFLICSDGLVDGMWDKRIDEMGRGELNARTLVDFAIGESGRDNTTAMLIEIA